MLEIVATLQSGLSVLGTLLPVLLLFPPALLLAGVWRALGAPPGWVWAAGGAPLVFGLVDGLALLALPRLGLSFGPAGFPWFGLSMLRLAIFLGLTVLWKYGGTLVTACLTPAGLRVGLALMWGLNLVVLGCALDALYIEPFRLTVTQLHLSAPPLGADRPLRIVQVSDLHVEYTTRREREVVARVAALEPDLIVLTGDYLNLSNVDDPRSRRDARDVLAQFHAPYGVYAIVGTVDRPDVMRELFTGLDITVLEDEVARVPLPEGELYLVGVSNLGWARDEAALPPLMREVPLDAYNILLYHTPDLADLAAAEGVDLYLAGHTHGGQIRLPFYGALVTFSRYGKRFEQGRYDLGATTLYISRGLGMEGWAMPRARFLCPPELVVIELE